MEYLITFNGKIIIIIKLIGWKNTNSIMSRHLVFQLKNKN
jgi:hypothetical protein